MFNEHPQVTGKQITAVWRSRNGKPFYFWTPERGTFRCKLTFISTGDRILTRLAKPLAKFVVVERNDFGTSPIGYLVNGRTAKTLKLNAGTRRARAELVRQAKQRRAEERERLRYAALERAAKEVSILPALFALNRAAKRLRDEAAKDWRYGDKASAGELAEQKRGYYWLKGQVLAWLVEDGTLVSVGHHEFPGGNVAEVLAGQGYRFHRPAPKPVGQRIQKLRKIDAKPPTEGELEEQLAVMAVRLFLRERPECDVYEWPPRERRARWNNYEDEDDEPEHWQD